MPYLQIAIVVGVVGGICWVTFYLYYRRNPDKFRGLGAVLAVVVLGPFLPLIQSSLARRNHELTSREMWGLVAVVALLVAAIAVTLIFGIGVRGQ
jgi:drug/metabolite transporter (DMT)-like permease